LKLLLTHAFFLLADPKEQQIMRPYAPLGILYLSSHLRKLGFDVDIYDSTFGSYEQLERILSEETPGAIGVYANLMTRGPAIRIIQAARERGWFVIAGGPEPTSYAEEYLASGAHVVVVGEGELALERLLAHGCDIGRLTAIPGLIFTGASGDVIRTGPGEMVHDLDAQPWPDRERIDLPRYVKTWRDHHGAGSVSVITARGCPYRCNWCSHSVFGHTHRRRQAGLVAAEVEHILSTYSPDMLWIADDVFTIHHGWLREYARALAERKIRIPFECITRADRMNTEVADLLAEIGCKRVWIGSESGSQRILDAMQRGVTTRQVHTAVELCRTRGIETGLFLMWGYEGEELVDIAETVEHVKQCRPDIFLTTVSYPIKGTPYFDKLSSRLVSIKSWAESTDRDFRIQGRHSRRFYTFADELLRREMDPVPDPTRIQAAMDGLHATFREAEA
jgi:anaerobic magnesium-protoporphyrin IX monomethyl ester cyclase